MVGSSVVFSLIYAQHRAACTHRSASDLQAICGRELSTASRRPEVILVRVLCGPCAVSSVGGKAVGSVKIWYICVTNGNS